MGSVNTTLLECLRIPVCIALICYLYQVFKVFDSDTGVEQMLPDKPCCTGAISVLKRGWFVIEAVVFREIGVPNVHQTVGMQHEFFRYVATYKQDL